MANKPYQQEMETIFGPHNSDNVNQSTCRNQFQKMYWNLESLPSGPEKSVAIRKLVEFMDAALLCHHR